MERVSRGNDQMLTRRTIGHAQALAELLLAQEQLEWEQRKLIGAAVRRILTDAWNASVRNNSLVVHAIRTVCEPFGTDPHDPANLWRLALEPGHLREHGHEELGWIAR